MKVTKTMTNNAGFSLIELMVVVAIIGVLASIAVPSVGKYMAKSRQSEAKANLASYYVSQKAFFAEYNSYDSRFGAIGYAPEGILRYNLGTASGFKAPGELYRFPTGGNVSVDTMAFCGKAPAYNNGCSLVQVVKPVLPSTTVDQAAFMAGAGGQIRTGATNQDHWTMNQNKDLNNVQDGTM